MSREIALATIDKFYGIFEAIDNIQFFGGEPLLNPELIDFISQEITRRHKDGKLGKKPQLAVVTNGTIQSDRIIEILREHSIKVTISMDGPEIVNDYLRGKDTSSRIGEFVHQLKQHDIEYSFEGTFTAHHIKAGMTLVDVLDFFFERFQQQQVHIPLAMLPPDDPLRVDKATASGLYRQAVEHSMEGMRNNDSACLSFAMRIADVFLKQEPAHSYCPAGFGTLSVDCMGDVSPCFMFTGIEEFLMGNVLDDLFPHKQEVARIFKTIILNEKANDPKCLECWAAPFCTGCIGADYISNGGSLTKANCDVVKSMVDGFLTKAATLATQRGDVSIERG
jgi:uncharacterized protein